MTNMNMQEDGGGSSPTTLDEVRSNLEDAARWQEDAARWQKDAARWQKDSARRHKEIQQELQETGRLVRETSVQMKETDRRLKAAEDLFTTQWGKLVESLVEGDLVPLLRQRGVDVTETAQRLTATRNGRQCELDIVARNGEEIVVVEVKTTLRPKDVKRFLDKISRLDDWFSWSVDRPVYGAMAYIRADASAARHAERQGLFVIRATGASASILNQRNFEPRVF